MLLYQRVYCTYRGLSQCMKRTILLTSLYKGMTKVLNTVYMGRPYCQNLVLSIQFKCPEFMNRSYPKPEGSGGI